MEKIFYTRHLLEATAALRDYPFPERSRQWLERLALNLAEMEAVQHWAGGGERPLLEPAFQGPTPEPPVAAGTGQERAGSGEEESKPAWQASGPDPARPESSAATVEPAAAGPVSGDTLGPSLSAGETARLVRAGKLSPVEAVSACLQRLDQARDLNAFITVDPALALADAVRIGERLSRGEDPGPLAGVPVAVKDLMFAAGFPLTGGSRAVDPVVATESMEAAAVARLRRAGAVVIGTTNLHELAYGITSINPHFGRVHNPHHPDHLAGGSSGGSAAAVAAGVVPAALGTDTGGSIRIPAACCGVVGLKPTYGSVATDGVIPLAWSLDHVGPITRTVADAALLFAVLNGSFEAGAGAPEVGAVLSRDGAAGAGPGWAGDGGGSIDPGRLLAGDLTGLRVVIVREYFLSPLAPEVQAAFERALALLEEAGARVAEVSIPSIHYAPGAQFFTVATEAAEVHRETLKLRGEDLGPDVRIRLEAGLFLFATDYVRAQRLRTRIVHDFVSALGPGDVLAAPTLPCQVPRYDTADVVLGGDLWPVQAALTRFTLPFNVTGLPALSLPCGRDRAGLPIGLQLAARPRGEWSVLRAAAALEAALGGTRF